MKIILDRPPFPCNSCEYFVDSEYTSIGKECVGMHNHECEKLEEWDCDKIIEITDEDLNEIGREYTDGEPSVWEHVVCTDGTPYDFVSFKPFSQYFRELIELSIMDKR